MTAAVAASGRGWGPKRIPTVAPRTFDFGRGRDTAVALLLIFAGALGMLCLSLVLEGEGGNAL